MLDLNGTICLPGKVLLAPSRLMFCGLYGLHPQTCSDFPEQIASSKLAQDNLHEQSGMSPLARKSLH